jgi:ABC-type sugar transport system substrate-binding protein
MRNKVSRRRLSMAACLALLALPVWIVASGPGVGASTRATPEPGAAMPHGLSSPTKALCKKSHYKIGYDVFSQTQPFAALVTKGLQEGAKDTGCATVLVTYDNINGPQAIANLHTLIEEGIQGFVDFQILEPFQPAIAQVLKSAKIPGVAIIGATLQGYPSVGANNYGASFKDGVFLAKRAKAKFPGVTPYLVDSEEPTSGAAIIARHTGVVAGVKDIYPKLPKSHNIVVDEDSTENDSYNNTLSALSSVPKDAVVLMSGTNDEVVAGMFKAGEAAHLKNFLVNSFGGDPLGLTEACQNPAHYVGALYLLPKVWGLDSLSIIMDEINGVKVPSNVGILGEEVAPHSACHLATAK